MQGSWRGRWKLLRGCRSNDPSCVLHVFSCVYEKLTGDETFAIMGEVAGDGMALLHAEIIRLIDAPYAVSLKVNAPVRIICMEDVIF